jgi:phosphoglycolate phosphatase-like HAD superfamily hydrolase
LATEFERPAVARLLPGTSIEIRNEDIPRGGIRSALFDFDGTVSLIREGWQGVMIPMMVDILKDLHTGESDDELFSVVREFVTRLTGRQTIYQMIEFAGHVERRGGTPLDPVEYKRMYLDLLWERIEHRVAGLKSGQIDPDDMIVPGARDLLKNLCERGISCYLASGTDEEYVLDEAAAVGVSQYFAGIYGALDNIGDVPDVKAAVIQNIIRDHNLHGSELVAFGDGYVEIENTKNVGGISIGVATDEVQRAGIDEWKRSRLIMAGADVVIAEFREQDTLVKYLMGEV